MIFAWDGYFGAFCRFCVYFMHMSCAYTISRYNMQNKANNLKETHVLHVSGIFRSFISCANVCSMSAVYPCPPTQDSSRDSPPLALAPHVASCQAASRNLNGFQLWSQLRGNPRILSSLIWYVNVCHGIPTLLERCGKCENLSINI